VELAGVAQVEAGLASGRSNASFQIGGAVGVAIVSTAAASQAGGSSSALALTHRFRSRIRRGDPLRRGWVVNAVLLLGKRRAQAPSEAGIAAAPAAAE
jgi:hypothetical protein